MSGVGATTTGALLLLALVPACRRDPAPSDAGLPAPSVSAVAAPSTSAAEKPMVSPSAHVAVLEEVAAIHRKKLPCAELESALAPLRKKTADLGDVADPRLGAAIEADADLRARRARALEAIMDGTMRCAR